MWVIPFWDSLDFNVFPIETNFYLPLTFTLLGPTKQSLAHDMNI